jgi:multidrug efflux pump subunit AcrB
LLATLAGLPLHVTYPLELAGKAQEQIRQRVQTWLDTFIERRYNPALRWAVRRPALVVCSSMSVLLLTAGVVVGGIVPFVVFPKLDSELVTAKITFPDGTPASVTDAATRRLRDAMLQLDRQFREQDQSVVKTVHRMVGQVLALDSYMEVATPSKGSHRGVVEVTLVGPEERELTAQQLADRWREQIGEIAGAESLTFAALAMGPGGAPIELKLMSANDHAEDLEKAVAECKRRLHDYPGVVDVRDDSQRGKWEYQVRIKQRAQAMGVPLAEVAETLRAAYHGAEVMRLQRGRHEVKLMVRYPSDQRESLASLDNIHVRTGNGAERPLTELADVHIERGQSQIKRFDQQRSVTITADVLEGQANAREVVQDLQSEFLPQLLAKYPAVQSRWEGQQEQTNESVWTLFLGGAVAVLAMFVLLTVEFRSYAQPLLILAILPFGALGAIWGHALMGLPITILSLCGLVALCGVVVNGSIVLIDFINHRMRDGLPLHEALEDAGTRRFRPVLLTTLTTIAGLTPLLLERSYQAQFLIPMAATLVFGLMVATFLVLILVPTLFAAYWRLTHLVPDTPEPIGADDFRQSTPSASAEVLPSAETSAPGEIASPAVAGSRSEQPT